MKAGLALIVFSVAAPSFAQPPSLDDLLETAGRYVRGFEQDFQTVISDETYVQRERQTRMVNGRERRTSTVRTIGSETSFMLGDEEGIPRGCLIGRTARSGRSHLKSGMDLASGLI